MRIITLYQPFATLMVMGLKTNETRSWRFEGVTGPLGIAAAAKTPKWCKELLSLYPFRSDLEGIALPTGCILGTVDLIGYQTSEDWIDKHSGPNMTDEQIKAADREFAYGDYSKGRYIWNTKNPVQFKEPIPAKGSQGFWKFDLPNQTIKHGQLYLFG